MTRIAHQRKRMRALLYKVMSHQSKVKKDTELVSSPQVRGLCGGLVQLTLCYPVQISIRSTRTSPLSLESKDLTNSGPKNLFSYLELKVL